MTLNVDFFKDVGKDFLIMKIVNIIVETNCINILFLQNILLK